jgi:hypothetical protein
VRVDSSTSSRWLAWTWSFIAAFNRLGTATKPALAIAMQRVEAASTVRARCRVRSRQALRVSVLTAAAPCRRRSGHREA